MGIHALVRNKKKTTKLRSLNKWHRAKKAEKKKKIPAPVLNVEDVHLFSVDKMKNKLRNPRNNIAISGKSRNRLMKRLRHNLRERSAMEVEVTSSSSKSSKRVSDEPSLEDEEMEESGVIEPESADVVVNVTAATSSSSSLPKKKKHRRKKGKKGADVDINMEED